MEPEAARVVAGLRARVEELGYPTTLRLHTHEVAPRYLSGSIGSTIGAAPNETRILLRLFQLEESVDRRDVELALGSGLVADLEAVGLLVEGVGGGGDALAARYRIDVIGEDVLLTENFSRSPMAVYYAEDSQFLRHVIRARAGDRALDLCTGTGVQGIRLAQRAAHVDLVDLNPAAVRLARLNSVMNDVADRVDVHEGDLWEALPAEARFDVVVSNPPLMPVADAVPYPLCGHGGPDGLRIVTRILEALPTRLTDRGRCVLIGACTGDERADVEAVAEEALEDGFRVRIHRLSRWTLTDWVASVSRTAEIFYPDVSYAKAVLRSRIEYGADANERFVFTYLLESERCEGEGGFQVVDYAGINKGSYWFLNRGTLAQ